MRALALATGLLGLLLPLLALAPVTAWLLLPAHLSFTLGLVALLSSAAIGGRPAAVQRWVLWFVLVTLGCGAALHWTNWADGGWWWALPFLAIVAWSGLVPAAAWVAGPFARRRRYVLARGAARRRGAR